MLKNPELEIKTPLIEPALVREQSNKLKKITNQIQAAHKGEDIKWWDEVINIFCTKAHNFRVHPKVRTMGTMGTMWGPYIFMYYINTIEKWGPL